MQVEHFLTLQQKIVDMKLLVVMCYLCCLTSHTVLRNIDLTHFFTLLSHTPIYKCKYMSTVSHEHIYIDIDRCT